MSGQIFQGNHLIAETNDAPLGFEQGGIEVTQAQYDQLVEDDNVAEDTNYYITDTKVIMRNNEKYSDGAYQNLYSENGTVDLNDIVEPGKYWLEAYVGSSSALKPMTVLNAPEDCKTTYSVADPTTTNPYVWFFLEVEATLNTEVNKLVIYQKIHSTKSGLTADYSRRCYCQGATYDSTVDSYSAWVKNSTSREIKNFEKKIAMFGGSVAAGSLPYVFPHLEDTLGTRKLYSYATGGAGFNAGTNFRTQIATMISEHPTEKVDVAVFWCSTNDWSTTARGTFIDYSYYNNWGQDTSVQAAAAPDANMSSSMNYCFKTLYDYNPNIEIYVIMPLRCYTRREGWDIYDNRWQNETQNARWPFQRWVDAMKQICNIWCVPYLDLWNASGINFYNETTYLSDHLHPTAAGYNKIKYQIGEFLKSGGYGCFNPVLPHQDENVWVFPNSNFGDLVVPCRSDDGIGNEQSNYVELVDNVQAYYIRDGICICSFALSVTNDITSSSTPLLRGMPRCQNISNTSLSYIAQCPLIARSGPQQYSTAYAYLTPATNSNTGLRETVLVGDGLKAGNSYRGFICYPVENR